MKGKSEQAFTFALLLFTFAFLFLATRPVFKLNYLFLQT